VTSAVNLTWIAIQVEQWRELQAASTERLRDLRRALGASQDESSSAKGRAETAEAQNVALLSEVAALRGQTAEFKVLQQEIITIRVRTVLSVPYYLFLFFGFVLCFFPALSLRVPKTRYKEPLAKCSGSYCASSVKKKLCNC
jgi:hypothetical protein